MISSSTIPNGIFRDTMAHPFYPIMAKVDPTMFQMPDPRTRTLYNVYDWFCEMAMALSEENITNHDRWISVPEWVEPLLRKDERFTHYMTFTPTRDFNLVRKDGRTSLGHIAGFEVSVHSDQNPATKYLVFMGAGDSGTGR